ncbi:uncharacterized protein PGRI_084750 [Penicillium griseofulvum]|uniref:Uncharacterized protein n=1 Tax=Penicillium patulum TaxID=5078 RepID=A0A135LTE3_PENPA|nr:uncharacterized protein PGRI_084750 [Penicillium griseofulvum]KXG52191.1 hypothetical protein PGRI_084750 [Penicillium griseofulvum]
MSSRRRYAVDPSYPPLSEIIELEPEKEPWCAGYAPSKGRRCHARTNAHGRRSATAILNEGTKELRAGRSVTSLLKELAPHVLCTRFHQNQASDLVSRWKRDVRAYRDSQDAYIPPARSTRRSSRSVYLDSIESDSEETIDFLQQRLRYLQEEVRRLEVARYGSPISAPPRTRRVDRSTSAVSSGNVEPAPRRSTPRESLAEETVRRRPLQPINESEINVPRPAQAQVSTQTREVPVSSSRPATPPATAPASSSTGNPQIQDEAPQAIRRQVEGECGICLENLHISQEEVDTNEEQEIEHSGDNDDDSDDHNNPVHDDPEHDDPEHNDPQHDESEHNDPQHDDPEHNDPQHDDPEHNDPQHDTMTLSTMTLNTMILSTLTINSMILSTMTLNTMTLSTMTLNTMSFNPMTLSTMTLSTMTPSTMSLNMLSLNPMTLGIMMTMNTMTATTATTIITMTAITAMIAMTAITTMTHATTITTITTVTTMTTIEMVINPMNKKKRPKMRKNPGMKKWFGARRVVESTSIKAVLANG